MSEWNVWRLWRSTRSQLRIRSMALARCIGSFFLVCLAMGASAQTSQPGSDLIRQIQDALIWTGHYDGLVDGQMGRRTLEAWNAYQRSTGNVTAISPDLVSAHSLLQVAQYQKSRVSFEVTQDPVSRTVLGIPKKLAPLVRITTRGTAYSSADTTLKIDSLRFNLEEKSLIQLFDQISSNGPIRTVTYSKPPRSGDFAVAGFDNEKQYYFRAIEIADGIIAFSIAYTQSRDAELRPLIAAIASSFKPISPVASSLLPNPSATQKFDTNTGPAFPSQTGNQSDQSHGSESSGSALQYR